jgi:F-type H+-transporting ATPase subunit b
MSVLGAIIRLSAGEVVYDESGIVTHSWLLPETPEIIWGGLASLIVFGLLYWKAWPVAKQSLAARTDKIQRELDGAADDQAAAAAEAAQIRQAKGDIEAERARILADADAQASTVITDGRARLTQELAELEARADAEIEAGRARVGDELRAEIARLSTAAVDHVVTGSLDDSTQQELIEGFIARVGAAR